MKNIIISMSLVFMIVISTSIVFVIDGRGIRQQETTDSLSTAIEGTLQEIMIDKAYTVNNPDELIADFIQAMLIQINSNAKLTVNILDIDMEKGLLSIEVIESFKHVNGNQGTVSCVKTVILEQPEISGQENQDKSYSVIFQIQESGKNFNYKTYTLIENTKLIIPEAPVIENKEFKYWITSSGQNVDDNSLIKVQEDLVLTAVFD